MITSDSLKQKLQTKLQEKGFDLIELNIQLVEAIAEAVVEEITTNAQVNVTGGSSAGTYQVS